MLHALGQVSKVYVRIIRIAVTVIVLQFGHSSTRVFLNVGIVQMGVLIMSLGRKNGLFKSFGNEKKKKKKCLGTSLLRGRRSLAA